LGNITLFYCFIRSVMSCFISTKTYRWTLQGENPYSYPYFIRTCEIDYLNNIINFDMYDYYDIENKIDLKEEWLKSSTLIFNAWDGTGQAIWRAIFSELKFLKHKQSFSYESTAESLSLICFSVKYGKMNKEIYPDENPSYLK
jgi:hypothetical protein